jgi:hypothetical protein
MGLNIKIVPHKREGLSPPHEEEGYKGVKINFTPETSNNDHYKRGVPLHNVKGRG